MKALHIIAAASLAMAAGSCSHKGDGQDTAAAPAIEVTPVLTDSVTMYKTFPGTLSADATVNVVGRVNGTLASKQYTSGQSVKKGQVLFTIESTSYRDAVQQAEAELTTARSRYDYATRQRKAMEQAFKSDAVSEMEVIQAVSNEREAEAAIRTAEAALSTARSNLGYCTVTAPISGRVDDNTLSVGNYISGEGSPTTLCTIYDIDYVLVHFSIEDVDLIGRVREAMKAGSVEIPVRFSEKLAHDYHGTLQYVAPNMNNSTGALALQVMIANPYGELLPGMYAEVSLPTGVNPRAMLVRDASLSTDQLGKFLYTVNDSDRIVYSPVKTGELVNDTMRVILSGIEPGQRYVTAALLKVREGMSVKPVESR